jgi:DNA polymerase
VSSKDIIANAINNLKIQEELGVSCSFSSTPMQTANLDTITEAIKAQHQNEITDLLAVAMGKKQAVIAIEPVKDEVKKPTITPAQELQNRIDAVYKLLDSINTIEELRKTLDNFSGCDLKQTAQNTVFADGTPSAKIMVIGEAPGEEEDKSGIPFCGRSGKLLDKVLASVGFSRSENIYITNCVFWRPPANRKPTDDETAICKPFLEKHIALINPNLIILCGSTAMETVIGEGEGITKMCGKFTQYTNRFMQKPIEATVIFHPSFLLRNPIARKPTWFNMLQISQHIHQSNLPT